jgi:hypothetical protein
MPLKLIPVTATRTRTRFRIVILKKEFLTRHPQLPFSPPSMYSIRSAGPKGLGVFAKSFIPRGTRIFSEEPLLSIPQNTDASSLYSTSRLLSPEKRIQLLQLSSHVNREQSIIRWNQAFFHIIKQTFSDLRAKLGGRGPTAALSFPRPGSIKQHSSILSIFRSNAFAIGAKSKIHQAVFPLISRINHSCIPNSQGNFHETLGKFNIHATRDINIDEELTLNYLQEHGSLQASRQSRLLAGHGFTCECPACDLTLSRGKLGEESRLKMHEALRGFTEVAGKDGVRNTEEELRITKLFIELLEGEGVAGREVATM